MAASMSGSKLAWLCYLLYFWSVFFETVTARKPLQTTNFQVPEIYPESFDWDAKHERFILGSTTMGSLLSLSLDGTVEEFVKDVDYAGKAAVLGVSADAKNNRVVAAVQDLNNSAPFFSGIAAYNLDSKERLFFTRLDNVRVEEGERSCSNDLAIDQAGNSYVTNCFGNFLWKVTKEGSPSVFTQDPLLSSQQVIVDPSIAFCGLNGIAYHREGFLIVGQTNSGVLFRIELDDASVRVVQMRDRLPSADGMAFRADGTLVVVSTEKVWLVGSASNWYAANVVDSVLLNSSDFVTAVVIKEHSRTYVLPAYLTDQQQGIFRKDFQVREIEFLAEFHDNDPLWLVVIIVLFVVAVFGWRFQMAHFYKQYRQKRA